MRRRPILFVLAITVFVAGCRERVVPEEAVLSGAQDRAPSHNVELTPPAGAVAVADGVHVQKLREGDGEPIARIAPADGLLGLTGYIEGGGVFTSVEPLNWPQRPQWWRAALADARVGDERRVWFCSAEAKAEWGEAARQPCIAVDVVLMTNSTHGTTRTPP